MVSNHLILDGLDGLRWFRKNVRFLMWKSVPQNCAVLEISAGKLDVLKISALKIYGTGNQCWETRLTSNQCQ